MIRRMALVYRYKRNNSCVEATVRMHPRKSWSNSPRLAKPLAQVKLSAVREKGCRVGNRIILLCESLKDRSLISLKKRKSGLVSESSRYRPHHSASKQGKVSSARQKQEADRHGKKADGIVLWSSSQTKDSGIALD